MLAFLRKTKESLSKPPMPVSPAATAAGRTTRDWVTVVLPRLTAPADTPEQDAQLILGSLRLILSRNETSEHASRLNSAVKLESMLCEFLLGGDPAVLRDTRIMALSLTEVRHLLDPTALRTLQRWYRDASDEASTDNDAFKKSQFDSKH